MIFFAKYRKTENILKSFMFLSAFSHFLADFVRSTFDFNNGQHLLENG